VKPGGVIAFHVTNRFVDLAPVVARLAEAHHLHALFIHDQNETPPAHASDWVLLSDRREALDRPKLTEAAKPIGSVLDFPLWTDDFNNIIGVLR
jgi:hypothetical protein